MYTGRYIGKTGARMLSEALKYNITLTELNLNGAEWNETVMNDYDNIMNMNSKHYWIIRSKNDK